MLGGFWALRLRTESVVVRRKVRCPPSSSSTVIVCSATWTVILRWAWVRPRAIFCPTTMITPLLNARRCTVIASTGGRVGVRPGGRRAVCGLGPSSAGWVGCAAARGCQDRRTSAWCLRCGWSPGGRRGLPRRAVGGCPGRPGRRGRRSGRFPARSRVRPGATVGAGRSAPGGGQRR